LNNFEPQSITHLKRRRSVSSFVCR